MKCGIGFGVSHVLSFSKKRTRLVFLSLLIGLQHWENYSVDSIILCSDWLCHCSSFGFSTVIWNLLLLSQVNIIIYSKFWTFQPYLWVQVPKNIHPRLFHHCKQFCIILRTKKKQKTKNRKIRKLSSRYHEHPRRHHLHEKQCCEYVCLFNRCIQRPTFQMTCLFPFARISLWRSMLLR